MEKNYDVAILGGGPAGLTAGIYSARYGLKTALISKDTGGMSNYASFVENYPAFTGSGFELMQSFLAQAKKEGVDIIQREIVNLSKDNQFLIQTSRNEIIKANSIIICLGTKKRKLNIPGEDKFLGKGVSYCVTCDATFFKDKAVAVVGGRNSAAHSALMLSLHAKKVYIAYRQKNLNCDGLLLERIKNSKNIEIVYESTPLEIRGDDAVKNFLIMGKGKERELKVEGVFVEIGSVPSTSIIKKMGVNTDKEGYIIVNDEMKTNVKGIFAAGDITSMPLKQIITAASNGAVASFSAYKFLKEGKNKAKDE